MAQKKAHDLQNMTLKKEAMIKALSESMGIVSSAAKKVGICRNIHYEWMKEDSKYKASVEELNNVVLDFAESALMKRIKEGSDACLLFLLKCKGKERGYVEKESAKAEEKNIIVIERVKCED